MKNIVITIIGFAIAIGLIVGVIIPIASHGKTTGQTANTSFKSVDTSVSSLSSVIN